jgi:hypothetical protein
MKTGGLFNHRAVSAADTCTRYQVKSEKTDKGKK